MKLRYIHLPFLLFLTLLLSCVSCTNKDSQNTETGIVQSDLGTEQFNEPIVGTSKRPESLINFLNSPFVKWAWTNCDTITFTRQYEITYNDDAVRNKSKLNLYPVCNTSGVELWLNGKKSTKQSPLSLAAHLGKSDTITLEIMVPPSIGDSILSGQVIIDSNSIDEANGIALSQDSTEAINWKAEQKIGWPILLWSFIIILIIVLILILVLALKYLGGYILCACSELFDSPSFLINFIPIGEGTHKHQKRKEEKEKERKKTKKSKKPKRFFNPSIGKKYKSGIRGKKILVFGDSFYCKYIDCPHFFDCTDVEKKDSSAYNKKCPYADYYLEDEPSNATSKTYTIFANFLISIINDNKITDCDKFWNHVAFTNYIQFFLPQRETRANFIHPKRDFMAFNEVVEDLQPDIIIVWGTAVMDDIISHAHSKISNIDDLQHTYLYNGEIYIIKTTHPAAPGFNSSKELFKKQLLKVLET